MRTLTVLLALALTACGPIIAGNGRLSTESRNVAPFTGVENDSGFDLRIVGGRTQDVVVTIDDNLQSRLRTHVEDGVLVIHEADWLDAHTDSLITISVPHLDFVHGSGSGDILVTEVDDDRIEVISSGSGDIDLSGDVGRATYTVKGSGDVDGRALRAETADVLVSGSGDVHVNAKEDVSIDITGSGEVWVSGDAPLDLGDLFDGQVHWD